eukprot:4535641-Pleurochrysis_carterae.AAC.5
MFDKRGIRRVAHGIGLVGVSHLSCYRACGTAIDGLNEHRRGATNGQRVSRLAGGHASPVPECALKATADRGRRAVERVRALPRGRAKAC